MKRTSAVVIALILLLAIPLATVEAAGNGNKGDLYITSEKVKGKVSEVVKVDFYLYPNLPEGRKLDSLSGSLKFDPEFITFGSINQVDEEKNLSSLMKGRASAFVYNIVREGELKFVFADPYGVEEEGFWFQAEFRIEKEGATGFIFNGIEYTAIDDSYSTIRFMIDPVSVGGIFTEGNDVPDDGAAEETFAPLTPAMETPAPATPTPKPSAGGHVVPVVSAIPTYSPKPTENDNVTEPPATPTPTEQPAETETPDPTDTPAPVPEPSPDPVIVSATEEPQQTAEITAFPIEGSEEKGPDRTAAPELYDEASVNPTERKAEEFDLWLIVGLAAAMVAILGLGMIAIILLVKRRRTDGK